MDPYVLYQHLLEAIHGRGTLEVKEIQAQMPLGLTTDQLLSIRSFQQLVPTIFTGNKESDSIYTGGAKISRFPHRKIFKQWEDDSRRDGLRVQIDRQVLNVRTVITTLIV